MEGKGRGSASARGLAAALVVVALVVQCEVASAATTYTVGGTGGWTFNVDGWPRGKHFRPGDILVFNYNPGFHNLVPVNKAGYDSCTAPRSARLLQSGKDRITLSRGTSYFICTFPGHCRSGMKIAVTAA
ncbi:hypothetical protein Dimus_018007 [Dionaea muscipula]